ncbi:MAG: Bax inhibitor-1 family protein [Acidobacteriota bacterium]
MGCRASRYTRGGGERASGPKAAPRVSSMEIIPRQHSVPEAVPVAELNRDVRATFIARTYIHLFAAIVAFVGLEVALFALGFAEPLSELIFSFVSPLTLLGLFLAVSWMVSGLAQRIEREDVLYPVLGVYVAALAVLFAPLLAGPWAAPVPVAIAALLVVAVFGSLTAISVSARRDFSLRAVLLRWGLAMAPASIVAFQVSYGLGLAHLVLCASGLSILHETSRILEKETRNDRFVAASIRLLTSIAMLVWYALSVLRWIFGSGKKSV